MKIKKIVVEVPVGWFENPLDGSKNKKFFSAFLIELSARRIPLSMHVVPFSADQAARTPEKGVLIFSYHSRGDEKNVWHLKEAPVSPLFSIDKRGYSGWADIAAVDRYLTQIEAINLDDAHAILSQQKQLFLEKRDSKYPQPDSSHTTLPNKYVFFPLQVQDDPVSELSDIQALDLLQEASKWAFKSGIHLLVKRHPFCNSLAVSEVLRSICERNPYVVQVDENIHTLIINALSVITINSGVGLEALIHGATVYCTGKSEWFEAAKHIKSLNDLSYVFNTDPVPMNDFQKKLVAFLISEYWVDPDDVEKLGQKIDQCIADFDFDFGLDTQKIDPSDVLQPIILDLQSQVTFAQRQLKLAKMDFHSAEQIIHQISEREKQIESEFHHISQTKERLEHEFHHISQAKERLEHEFNYLSKEKAQAEHELGYLSEAKELAEYEVQRLMQVNKHIEQEKQHLLQTQEQSEQKLEQLHAEIIGLRQDARWVRAAKRVIKKGLSQFS